MLYEVITDVEAAVGAAVLAVVGQIERDEHLDRPPEVLHGQLLGPLRDGFEMIAGTRAEQGQEIHRAWRVLAQGAGDVRVGHAGEEAIEVKTLIRNNFV